MKTHTKTITVLALTLATMIFACKKEETKKEDPATPVPTGPSYSNFSSTIAIIDYTAPVNVATVAYTANISPTTKAIAYIVADGARIDSLPLVITFTPDIVPPTVTSSTASACDKSIWETYNLNSKEFKVKDGANNSLHVYENGVLIVSKPIKISTTYIQYDFNAGTFVTSNPFTGAGACADGKRFRVIH